MHSSGTRANPSRPVIANLTSHWQGYRNNNNRGATRKPLYSERADFLHSCGDTTCIRLCGCTARLIMMDIIRWNSKTYWFIISNNYHRETTPSCFSKLPVVMEFVFRFILVYTIQSQKHLLWHVFWWYSDIIRGLVCLINFTLYTDLHDFVTSKQIIKESTHHYDW